MRKSVELISVSSLAFMDLKAQKVIKEKSISLEIKVQGSVAYLKAQILQRCSLKLTIKQDCRFRVMTIELLRNS
jgi:hypothetical protein